MASRYEKNYTESGYRMNYRKDISAAPYKNRVLQFRIEIPEILPLIWRRILVPSDYNFWDLHVAIQDSMGWLDYHLHHFRIKAKGGKKERRIGIPDFERFEELPEIYPGWEIPVLQYFNDLGVRAAYLYDYGDSWWHNVTLEGYLIREKNEEYPVCIAGERACPPEDCGGVPGYYDMLKTLSDPDDEEYEDTKAWVGKDWSSERFNREGIVFCNPHKRWVGAFLED
ncbi:MAG: plasmid pRiA4b ORF-3 family protein [Chitinispirillaceae bacterium]